MKADRQNDRREWADFKRLLEICMSNPQREEAFLEQPEEWLAKYSLKLQSSTAANGVRLIGCPDAAIRRNNPYVTLYDEIIDKVHRTYDCITLSDRISNPYFKAWYERQKKRCFFQSSISRHIEGLFYIPVTFELSDGCSMGCPFCCLAAGKLKSVFLYSEENKKMWRIILEKTRELIGDIVDAGVCYFATEPLDNPEYEYFLQDFYHIFGRYPQTTTAASVKNIERTKALMNLLGEEALKQAALRFSVVSLEQLDRIHRAFSSEELKYVEVLLNNPESVYSYAKSGRSVALSQVLTNKGFLDNISCVCTCGFVVNPVTRTIMLVSPHLPDAKHPLGMKIYEKQEFYDEKDYGTVLRKMVERWMPLEMPEQQPLYPAAHITWQRRGYRVQLKGDKISRNISLSDREYRCFNLILKQNQSFAAVCDEEKMTEYERRRFGTKLKCLYDAGCLEEVKN